MTLIKLPRRFVMLYALCLTFTFIRSRKTINMQGSGSEEGRKLCDMNYTAVYSISKEWLYRMTSLATNDLTVSSWNFDWTVTPNFEQWDWWRQKSDSPSTRLFSMFAYWILRESRARIYTASLQLIQTVRLTFFTTNFFLQVYIVLS